MACGGQSVALGGGKVKRVHLLAASTAAGGETRFGLKRADGEVEAAVALIPGWMQRTAGARVGAYAPYVRKLNGDDGRDEARLYHVTLSAPEEGAVSLELPKEPRIKIMAITVEEG